MIHFKQDLIDKAKKLKNLNDYLDACNDLNSIDHVLQCLNYMNDSAWSLHEKLINKYIEINIMLNVANTLPRKNLSTGKNVSNNYNLIEELLIQDMFGIYTHILLKSKEIIDVKDFIDYVD